MQGGTAAVERVFREEYGRLVASLVRRFGDVDIAEEAASAALLAALETWPESGVPPNPGGWLTTAAGNRAIDRIRRERQRDAKHQAAFMHHDDTPMSRRDRSRTNGCGCSSPAATRRSHRRHGSR